MAKEYKILQVALGAEDVETALNHTVREDWNFLSCVALGPQVLCYTFWREKTPAGRRRIEDSASSIQSSEFDSKSISEKEKALDEEFRSICEEVREGKLSTSREADTVAAAVLASKVVSTDKAKKILSRSGEEPIKKVRRRKKTTEAVHAEVTPTEIEHTEVLQATNGRAHKDHTVKLEVAPIVQTDNPNSEVRISPRTGKPMRAYKKRIK